MRTKITLFVVFAFALALSALAWAGARERPKLYDKQIARVHSGTAVVDVSEAVWTGYTALITIEPTVGHALYDASITIDLDYDDSTNGWAGGYTSETIRFAVARKVMGNWRIDTEKQSATVTGTAGADRSVTLDLGIIGPTEDCRIYVVVSAEQTDFNLAYVLSYRGPSDATITDTD